MDIVDTFEIENPYNKNLDVCDPYLAQDGYDSGQVMVCRKHNSYTRVVFKWNNDSEDQSYKVTLDQFQKMVDAHKEKFKE